jgi:hypothetical protein
MLRHGACVSFEPFRLAIVPVSVWGGWEPSPVPVKACAVCDSMIWLHDQLSADC